MFGPGSKCQQLHQSKRAKLLRRSNRQRYSAAAVLTHFRDIGTVVAVTFYLLKSHLLVRGENVAAKPFRDSDECDDEEERNIVTH